MLILLTWLGNLINFFSLRVWLFEFNFIIVIFLIACWFYRYEFNFIVLIVLIEFIFRYGLFLYHFEDDFYEWLIIRCYVGLIAVSENVDYKEYLSLIICWVQWLEWESSCWREYDIIIFIHIIFSAHIDLVLQPWPP